MNDTKPIDDSCFDLMANHQSNGDEKTAVIVTDEVQITKPKMYHVILLNDDYTPMDFVVELLMIIFKKNFEQASNLMMAVHQKGRAVAGTYTHEIAIEKMTQANETASANSFPLQTIIEEA